MIEIGLHPGTDTAKLVPADGALVASARRRMVPIVCMVAIVATTMAYSLLWGPLVAHSAWITPGDIWGTFRTAQFVAWGDIGDVYSSGGALVSLPGISVALAPAALLVNHLGLAAGFPFAIAHPAAWLVLGPYEAALGAIVLIPLDILAEELGIGRGARTTSSILEAVALWPLLALWGHPEDSVAMAFAIWGLVAALRGRWRAVGWLFGLALVMQPLVVLMLPIVVAVMPKREWPKLALRGAVPSVALVSIPLVQSWRQTTAALLKQPNYPTVDHPTPWLSLAPVLSKTHVIRTGHIGQGTSSSGASRFTTGVVHSIYGETVAAGPGRLIALAFACLIGVYVYRSRPTQAQIVWLCCVALSLRCVFEAVMNPYYLWPPLAIAFVLVVRSRWRLGLAIVSSAGLTWWSYRHLGPWEWWVPVVILLVLVVAAAKPARTTRDLVVEVAGRRGRHVMRAPMDALV